VLLALETLTQQIEQVRFLLKRWSYLSGCSLQQALSFLLYRAMDWPNGFAWNEGLTIDFKKETLLKVYPGIERIPSLKKRVGTDIGASFIIEVEMWVISYTSVFIGFEVCTLSQILVNTGMLGRFLIIAIQLWGQWDSSPNPSFMSLFFVRL
jgi:hypothetical protein